MQMGLLEFVALIVPAAGVFLIAIPTAMGVGLALTGGMVFPDALGSHARMVRSLGDGGRWYIGLGDC